MTRLFVFLFFLTLPLHGGEGSFLLLLGPSGVGKSTLIHLLKEIDSRFTYISPYTTRPLRQGETDKIHVSEEEIAQMESNGLLLTINKIYGIYYATPKATIDDALSNGLFPVLDWPVNNMAPMFQHYPKELFIVYIAPDDIAELEHRLALDDRDRGGSRFLAGKKELENYQAGFYDDFINLKITNGKGQQERVACEIYQAYMDHIIKHYTHSSSK